MFSFSFDCQEGFMDQMCNNVFLMLFLPFYGTVFLMFHLPRVQATWDLTRVHPSWPQWSPEPCLIFPDNLAALSVVLRYNNYSGKLLIW